MSDNFSDSSNSKPKKTVNESQLNSQRAKETIVEPNRSQPSRTPFVRKDPLLGKTIGDNNRYLLQTLLGQGGMSKVYQALDTKFEDKVVAIKLMTNYFATNKQHPIKRFMGEIKAISRLKHANIIQVFDFDITPNEPPFDGVPFYVMEHLEGKTLHNLLSQNCRISSNSILNIIRQVCAGLKTAHDKGIIHRDLKPDNIFLVEDGTFGEVVKIIDFGIAKNINADAQNSTQLTKEGFFVGTYRYASPEQCRGASIDCRTDIYSLGIIMYEAICGENPYGLDVDSDISQADWIACHINVAPQPLAEQPGCENIADELKSAIAKCLSKFPQDRFSNLEELQNAFINLSSVTTEMNYDLETQPKPTEMEAQPASKPTEVEEARSMPKPTEVETSQNNAVNNATTSSHVATLADRKLRSRRKILQYGGLFLLGILSTSLLAKLFTRSLDNPPNPKANNSTKPNPKFEISLVQNIQTTSATEIWSLAISPDGQFIASGNALGTIELIDRHTGKVVRVLGEHENVIRSLAFIPQTNKIVSGDGNGNIKIWHLQNNSLERQLEAHSASIWSLAVSPNGQTLISSSCNGLKL